MPRFKITETLVSDANPVPTDFSWGTTDSALTALRLAATILDNNEQERSETMPPEYECRTVRIVIELTRDES